MPQGNKPLFSVIVPAYNVAEYLPQCIESVLTQSLPDFELILVDDGSTDQTSEICDAYDKKKATKNQPHNSIISQIDEKVNIKVIHQSNQGLSAARNAGVAAASGEYLVFLDGDDYLETDALAAIKAGLEPGLDILRYQAQEVFDDGRVVRHEETGFATTTGIKAFPELARYHYTENAWLYAYRRAFFVEHQFHYAPGCLAEDLGLTPLVIATAASVKAISDICYDYRQRAGSIMHDQTKIARRTHDIMRQFRKLLPAIAAIPHTAPILHYLVVSFLTGATELGRADFLQVYHDAKRAGLLQYIHPASPKAMPRALMLKHFPGLFYRVYHH